MKNIYTIPVEFKIKSGRLDVSVNSLTSLSELPEGLLNFDCSNNDIKTIPKLPSTLIELDCACNKIKYLPELPDGLIHLYCYSNKLTSLPELPDSLESLYCDHNPLKCMIPERFLQFQEKIWLLKHYYPFIKSYAGQKFILTKYPLQCGELIKQAKILKKIRSEFSYLFESCELNLI